VIPIFRGRAVVARGEVPPFLFQADGLMAFLYLSSFIELYRTGTISIVSISIVIPPNDGIAIGTIISLPRPVLVNTGKSAKIVVAVVIRQGRIRRVPARGLYFITAMTTSLLAALYRQRQRFNPDIKVFIGRAG
jgi:hypothetical protein